MDCVGEDIGKCAQGIGDFEIDRVVQGAAMFKTVSEAGRDLISGVLSTIWDGAWNTATHPW
jgi:hypothetical protein